MNSTAGPAASLQMPGLPTPRRHWAALSIWLVVAAVMLDIAMVNITLPVMTRHFGVAASDSIWVVNAFQIAIVLAVLPLSALGDLLGYHRVYRWGVVLFVAAAFACAMAPNLLSLSLFRFLQGLGAAGITSVNMALLRFIFPQARLGRGIGFNAFIIALMAAVGPALASFIISHGSWRWIFAIHVPLGIASLAIGWRSLPRPPIAAGRLAIGSTVLNAIALGSLFFAAAGASRSAPLLGWLAAALIGIGAGYWLIVRERRVQRPLLPLDLIRIPVLRLSYISAALSFAGSMASLVALPFYLEQRFGLATIDIGLLLSTMAMSMAIGSLFAGRLVERVHPGYLGAVGLTVAAIGWSAMAILPSPAPFAPIFVMLIAMILCGTGVTFFVTPSNRTMMSAAPRDRSGAAAGMLTMSRLVGQTCGALVVVLLFSLDGADTRLTIAFAAAVSLTGALIQRRLIAATDRGLPGADRPGVPPTAPGSESDV